MPVKALFAIGWSVFVLHISDLNDTDGWFLPICVKIATKDQLNNAKDVKTWAENWHQIVGAIDFGCIYLWQMMQIKAILFIALGSIKQISTNNNFLRH